MFVVWILFAVVVWMITIVLVKWNNFKKLWLAGIIGMVIAVIIDSSLANGGLYNFYYQGIAIYGLPVFYILALYAGAIFIVHFYPWGNIIKGLLFFILANGIFLIFEWIMVLIGYFEHLHWSFVHSFTINIIGFVFTVYVYALLQKMLGKTKYNF